MKSRKKKMLSVLLALSLLAAFLPSGMVWADPDTISVTTENELRDAVAAPANEGGTISIDQDITLTTSSLTLNQNITLTSASGKALNVGSKQIIIPAGKNAVFGGDLRVQGTATASPGVVNVNGTFTLVDTASVTSGNKAAVYSYSTGATINITGGSVTASDAYALHMEVGGGGTVNVSGGVIEGAHTGLRVSGSGYKANISGGEIRGQTAVFVSTGAEADISGGVLTGTINAVDIIGTVDITGGTFTEKILTNSPGTVEMTSGDITLGGTGAGVYYRDGGAAKAFLTALPSSPVAVVSHPTTIPLSEVNPDVVYSIDSTSDNNLGAAINNDTDIVTLIPTAAGSRNLVLTATANGQTFKLTIPVTVITAQLATPANLAWNTTTPGQAKWDAVANASSYSVQLYKDGAVQGSPVSVSSGTEHDLTAIIEAAGSGEYTFTVQAIGNGTDYANSPIASASPGYNYAAPAEEDVCQIGTTKYSTLEAGITAALLLEDPTITLLRSITTDKSIDITYDNDTDIELDLNGHDLTVDTRSIPNSTALALDGGSITLKEGLGSFNVMGAFCGVSISDGAKVVLTSAEAADEYGVAVSAGGDGSLIQVGGNVTASGTESVGVRAGNKGRIEITGDIEVTGIDATGIMSLSNDTYVRLTGDVNATGIRAVGARAMSGGEIAVEGNVRGVFGAYATGNNSSIAITEDVTATGTGDVQYGVVADGLNAAVTVGGDVTANECAGAVAANGGEVQIEGILTAATSYYVKLGGIGASEGTFRTAEEYEDSEIPGVTQAGYRTYYDAASGSKVWIKDVGTPTGPAVWNYRSPLPSANFIEDMAYINGKYMALGNNSTLIISADGATWQKIPVGAATDFLTGITYGGGKYIIVGNATTYDYAARIYTSGNGTVWHETAAVPHHRLCDVAYGQGKFVAVGKDGKILISSDGENWVTKTVTYPNKQSTILQSVTYSDELGKFVAVGTRGTSADHRGGIMASADGENWTVTYSDPTNSLWDVAYGNGTFVAVGGKESGAYFICTSSDGLSWTQKSTGWSGYAQLFSVEFDGNQFIAAGRTNPGGSAFITTSPNGDTWTDKTGSGLPGFQPVASNGTQLVAMGGYGNIYTSDNLGTNWIYRTLGTTKTLKDVAWNGSNLYVAVGVEGVIQTSTDGISWTLQSSGTTKSLNKVDYLNNQFIAVGNGGTILTSVDGTTWTTRTSGTTGDLRDLAYGGDKYVVIGGASLSSVILTSNDCADWSQATHDSKVAFNTVAYGDGVFVALTEYGQVYRSDAGLEWGNSIGSLSSSSSKYPQDMIYVGGKFVAVGGYGEIYLSSNRGDSWTTVVSGLGRYSWGIAESSGNLVAASELGRIMASADGGTTWFAQPSGLTPNHYTSNNYIRLNGIVAGDNCFVAVGENGLVLQSEGFTVSIDADANDVLIAKAGLDIHNILGSGSNANESLIVANMNLFTSGSNGTAISWSSSKPEYITTSGKVTRPSLSAGHQVVYLTATISKGEVSDTKTFVVVVLAQPDPDISIVEAAVAALTFDVIKGSNAAANNIVSDLNLITEGDNGVTISWSSSKTGYIAADGTVTCPAEGSADQAVTLTATVSKGAVSRTKTFNLIVKALVDLDVQAVAAVKAALVNGQVTVAAGASQADKTTAVQNYVNNIISNTANASGVMAIVTHNSGSQYNIALSKGGASDSKSLTMDITESVDPDVAVVANALNAAENAAYSNMAQGLAGSETAIKAALKNTAVSAVSNSNVNVTINQVSYIPPVTGTLANPSGTDGSYTFTVTVSKGSQSQTTAQKTIIITAKTYVSPGGGGGSSYTDASLSVIKVDFDRFGGQDVTVILNQGSYTLKDLKNGSDTLKKGADYTVSGSTVTIKAGYLDSLTEGKQLIIFDMNSGADPILTITIIYKTNPDIGANIYFEDITADDWFVSSVMWAYESDLMKGISEKPMLFDPHGTTTRGMIVTILHRLEGLPAASAANSLDDVADGKWYTDAIIWAAEHNIISGYGNDKFGPEDPINREQMAAILYRYAQYKGYDVTARADLSGFADADTVSEWAWAAMSWANAASLIQGDGTKLTPTGNAERCQVAAILQRFIENIAK